MRQREEGACYVHLKNDSGSFALPRSEYPAIKQAWMKGAAFYEGHSFYGSELNIKLGEVVGISDNTPEAIRLGKEDEREANLEDSIE